MTITEWLGLYTMALPMIKTDHLESFWRQCAYGMLNKMMLVIPGMSVVHVWLERQELMMGHRDKRGRMSYTEESPYSEMGSLFQVSVSPHLNVGVVGVGSPNNGLDMKDKSEFA